MFTMIALVALILIALLLVVSLWLERVDRSAQEEKDRLRSDGHFRALQDINIALIDSNARALDQIASMRRSGYTSVSESDEFEPYAITNEYEVEVERQRREASSNKGSGEWQL
jgi:hypothetical protein